MIQQAGLFPHMTVAKNVATVPKLLGWDKHRIEHGSTSCSTWSTSPRSTTAPATRPSSPGASTSGWGSRGAGRGPARDPDGRAVRCRRPDHATRLQDELLRIQRELRKTIVFVTHDIDEAILLGDRIVILRGGRLAQYDTPEAILAGPADDFVADFVGADRGLKRLSLTARRAAARAARRSARTGARRLDHAPRRALDDAERGEPHSTRVLDGDGAPRGSVTLDALAGASRVVTGILAASGPVIPDFGEASTCVQDNRLFCPDWVRDNWGPVLQPALLSARQAHGDRRRDRLRPRVRGGARRAAPVLVRAAVRPFSALVYTIPSLALFQLLVPITGLTVTTVEVALISYTLLILFRNILTGFRSVPTDVLEAARGMGMGSFQVLRRVELPLALPAIMAGVRIATVSTIALATVAAFVIPEGLGRPIFLALRQFFNTELIVTALLAVGLALVADGLLVLAQRA